MEFKGWASSGEITSGTSEASRAKRDVCYGANPSYHRGCRDPGVSDGLLLGPVFWLDEALDHICLITGDAGILK